MRPLADTKDPAAVASEVQAIYLATYPSSSPSFVSNAFRWATDCFTGRYRDYQPIDARYHDFEHTLQGTLCLMRLLHGRHEAGVQPLMTERMFKLGLLAILLHDTGYLKRKDDQDGTGAKYTAVHVDRSAEFSAVLLAEKGFAPQDLRSVQNMIHCTGVNVDLKAIPFQDSLERLTGFALGTADLLGQMAADDYLEKLPILYQEFEESHQFCGGQAPKAMVFGSPEELIQRTPTFWEKYVEPKIRRDFEGLYRFLNEPYPDGPNGYLELIQANLNRLKQELRLTDSFRA